MAVLTLLIGVGTFFYNIGYNQGAADLAVKTSQVTALTAERDTLREQVTDAGTATAVEVTSPNNGDRVPGEFNISGTFKNLSPGEELWIVGVSDGSFYPQHERPVIRQANGEWTSPLIYLYASDGDVSGQQFRFAVVVVGREGAEQFAQLAEHFEGIETLPKDARLYDQVTVIGM